MGQTKRKTVAFLIAFGPEVRAFLHSGLCEHLSRQYNVLVVARNPKAGVFQNRADATLLAMPEEEEHPRLRRVRSHAVYLHVQWLNRKGRQKWLHYLPQPQAVHNPPRTEGVYHLLSRSDALVEGCLRLERRLGKRWGSAPLWEKLYSEHGVDLVVTSSHAAERILPALQTATNRGIPTLIVMNSWKDVYSKPHVSIQPTWVAVWNRKTAEDLLAFNSHLSPEQVKVVPSLHLEKFLTCCQVMDRGDFCHRVGLDASRPFVCYTSAAPTAAQNEEQIVHALMHSLQQIPSAQRPQVLLRLNPMEEGSRFDAVARQYANVVIFKPDWEWDRAKDWCAASREDSDIWLATVFHAALNVSIASTVTLEFAALGRPVVNICFDLPESLPQERSNRRFWEADFYREIREREMAVPAFSCEELFHHVSVLLKAQSSLPAGEGCSPVQQIAHPVHQALQT